MAERVHHWMKNWASLVVSGLIAIIQIGLLPWVRSVNSVTSDLLSEVRSIKEWQGNHEQAINGEKEKLRLEILQEVQKLLKDTAEKGESGQRELRMDIRDNGKQVQTVEVNMRALSEQVASMSQRLTDLRSEFRQAIIDMDFTRNSTK